MFATFICSILFLNFCLTCYCLSNCPITLRGMCHCSNYTEDGVRGLRVECTNMTASDFYNDFKDFKDYLNKNNETVLYVQVKNSKFGDLEELPSCFDGVRHLVLDNTGIDFLTLKQSNEMLKYLKSLRIYNERFTEIPEDFFNGFHALTSLELNHIGIAALSDDAFDFLEDTLKEIRLRGNRLRSIPIAIKHLTKLEIVDLSNNDICIVADDLSTELESSLKSLRKLEMNRINCTCGIEKSVFVTWIRSHAIKGVKCYWPINLNAKDVSITLNEDFCDTGAATKCWSPLVSISIVFTIIIYNNKMHFKL